MGKIAKWRQISKEKFEEIVNSSFSIREVGLKLGYTDKSSGGATTSIKRGIEFYNFDISHFKGQSWEKDNYSYEWMKNGVKYRSDYAKSLIFLRGRRCECCNLTEWNNAPIPLEVHHKDGDKFNNESDNLILLCPNCHALTDNWRRKRGCGGTADALD